MTHPADPDQHIMHASTTQGHPVLIRHLQRSDAPLLVDLYDQLSAESRRLRFFQSTDHLPREYVEHRAQQLATVDTRHEVVLVATEDRQDGPILAVGRLSQVDETPVAELAVVVRDDVQGHGLGSLLIDLLVQSAMVRGIAKIHAHTLPENTAVRHMIQKLGLPFHSETHSGLTEYEIELLSSPGDAA